MINYISIMAMIHNISSNDRLGFGWVAINPLSIDLRPTEAVFDHGKILLVK